MVFRHYATFSDVFNQTLPFRFLAEAKRFFSIVKLFQKIFRLL